MEGFKTSFSWRCIVDLDGLHLPLERRSNRRDGLGTLSVAGATRWGWRRPLPLRLNVHLFASLDERLSIFAPLCLNVHLFASLDERPLVFATLGYL